MRTLFGLFLLALAPLATAAWDLNGELSSLSFVSVKAGNVGEVHRFRSLSGSVTDDGVVSVEIGLASVDTLIPIRDERMRELLFEVAQFPSASVTAQVSVEDVLGAPIGSVVPTANEGVLRLKTSELAVTMQLSVARLSADRVMVSSAQPVVVNAASVGLVAGIEKLREVAGLPSISNAVPVSFVLVFDRAVPAPSLSIDNARVREPIPGQDKTVAYFSATNTGDAAVELVAAESPLARAVELHTNVRDGDMVRMRRLDKMTIAPGETVHFAPGGHHLMVFGVQALPESVPFELITAGGGRLRVAFTRVGLG